ncbi:MAG: hypothetical protein M0026_17300 [Nocardiopsaceae bacterium]|nr:hypothetical protein [Nocardiopsaceae bacterium]
MEIVFSASAAAAVALLAARITFDVLFRRKGVYHSRAERSLIITATMDSQTALNLATLRLNAAAGKNELVDNLEIALRLRGRRALSPPPADQAAQGDTEEAIAEIERRISEAEHEMRATTL